MDLKKVVLMPDSFKGTMSSQDICHIMREAIAKFYPDAVILSVPVADGGEGTVDCFVEALAGDKVFMPVSGPFFQEAQGFYGLLHQGKTAVIEMAAAAGLPLAAATGKLDPCLTTTFGVGQLIAAAARQGVENIVLGLGGSATNDGGTGMAAALGIDFYNAKGERFVPTGGTLKEIVRIDTTNRLPELVGIGIIGMCDIDNPMYGANGASYVFGPQKGADEPMLAFLDENLRYLSERIKADLGRDVAMMPGAGAAGAMGAGTVAFLDAQLKCGIDTVLDVIGFEEIAKNTDLIFTGEGKFDQQSLRGKVAIGISRRAKKMNVPVIAVVGDIGQDIESAYDLGLSAIFSINRVAVPVAEARLRCREDMGLTMENIMRFWQLAKPTKGQNTK